MELYFQDQIKIIYQKIGLKMFMLMKFMEICFKKQREKYMMNNTKVQKKQMNKNY